MTEIVYLEAGENPPEHEDWILVSPAPAGTHNVSMSVAHSKGMTFYYDTGLWPLEQAIQRAAAWASKHNIPVVHVEGAAKQ